MTLKEKISSITQQAWSYWQHLINNKQNDKPVVCLQLNKTRLSLLVATTKPRLQILQCQYFSGDLAAQQNYLTNFVATNQLQNTICHGVLALEDYRLILIDKPQVADHEIGEATKWLVKDLINFPIEEAVIDFFPAPTRIGQPNKLYVIITRLSWVNQFNDLITATGLKLQSINIAALALRNILSSLAIIGNSAILLMRNQDIYYILVVKEQLIYLERKLELNLQNASDPKMFEDFCNELTKELQYSIDFYQNRDKTIPIKIFVDPVLGQNQPLIQFIETALNLKITLLDTAKLLQDVAPEDRIKYLGVLGEALGLEPTITII